MNQEQSDEYLAELIRLRRTLIERFSESELRDLCFDLGVDYDSLPGESKADRARELVDYFARRHRIPKLVRKIEEMRPDISLSQSPFDTQSDTIWITTRKAMMATGCGPIFLRRLANRGRVRARKEGGKWFFDRQVLLAHVQGWIGTEEASEITDYTVEHVRWLAREGVVKASKIRGFWLLHKENLLAYCRRQR